jgi:hypothetical protein
MDITGLFGLKDIAVPRRLRQRRSFGEWWLVTVVVAIAWLSPARQAVGSIRRRNSYRAVQ